MLCNNNVSLSMYDIRKPTAAAQDDPGRSPATMELSEQIATTSRGKDAGAGDMTPGSPAFSKITGLVHSDSSVTLHSHYPGSAVSRWSKSLPDSSDVMGGSSECLLLSL
jgi:hypothetical protein